MSAEYHESFPCFGGTVALRVGGASAGGTSAAEAAHRARAWLEKLHSRLSRFHEESELSRLNRDPRRTLPASPLLRLLARSVVEAGRRSGGLVDGTLLGQLERAGYAVSLRDREPAPLAALLAGSESGRVAATPAQRREWGTIEVDEARGTISRPPGVRIDGGGLAKGLAADLVATVLAAHSIFAVDCCGDLRIGGSGGRARTVHVSNPFGEEPLHSFSLTRAAIATSGIGNRSWLGVDGDPGHHLLDPATGRPAFTGIVQATALAPTGFLAEVYAKAALLAGPDRASEWLPHGGVIVAEDGRVEVLAGRSGDRSPPIRLPAPAR